MDFKTKRWICLFAGIIIEACTGIAYAWSVFLVPLMDKFGCTLQEANLIYTSNFWFSAIGSILLGALAKKYLSIKKEVFLGSLVYVLCIIASAYATNYWTFFFLFGVMRSIGTALVYPVLISYAVELFPERSGFASGLMTAGFGSGAIIWAPLATSIFTRTGDVSKAFLALGIIFLVCMLPLSMLLTNAPKGFQEEMLPHGSKAAAAKKDLLYDVNRKEMVRLPFFYIVMIGLVFALSCGNIMVSQGSPIVRNVFSLAAGSAALVVSAMAVFNVIGRVACGAISDRLGKSRSVFLLLCLTSAMMLLLVFVRVQPIFIACLLMVIFCYGGLSSLVAPVTAELFGNKNVHENYSITYCVYALASLTGPMLGTTILTRTGSYSAEFVFGATIALAGAVIMLGIVKKLRNGVVDASGKAS